MKKSLLFLTVLLFALITFSPNVKASINKTDATIYIGEVLKLNVNDNSDYVMWKSNNKSVASVSKSGKVYGESAGVAKITATVGAGTSSIKYYCIVTVKSSFNVASKNIVCSEEDYQEVNIFWDNPNDDEMDYSFDDAYIASAKWINNKKTHTLRIIPENLGVTTINIKAADSDDIEEISDSDSVTLNIFVVKDAAWIPYDYMEQLGIDDLLVQANEIMCDPDVYENDPTITPTAINYKGVLIRYQFDDVMAFFNTDDLRAAGIL